MRTRRWPLALAVALVVALTGCAPGAGIPPEPTAGPTDTAAQPGVSGTGEPAASAPSAGAAAPSAGASLAPGHAPAETYTVGTRELALARGDRPLRTVLWFPTTTTVGGQPAVAQGAFPLVLFSHGLTSSPEAYQRIITRIASAGFVVAAPAYPYTNTAATTYNPADLVNQPADGSAVITGVLALNTTAGDPLAGHLDVARVAAAGHSGGAYTTIGMLSGARDSRLSAAVVIAGGSLGGNFAGQAAAVLFVHGDEDPVVSYGIGQAAYHQVPWPKAFLTIVDGDHGSYLYAPTTAAAVVSSTILDFLRWSLYADQDALSRIPGEAVVNAVTTFQSAL